MIAASISTSISDLYLLTGKLTSTIILIHFSLSTSGSDLLKYIEKYWAS